MLMVDTMDEYINMVVLPDDLEAAQAARL